MVNSWDCRRDESFHGLATFYRKFVKNFSEVCAPILETIKGARNIKFVWIDEAERSSQYLKQKAPKYPILVLLDLNKVFTIECDVGGVAIGVVLSHEGRPVAFFSEKLNDTKKFYAYDLEVCAMVQALKKWRHYLL